MNNLSILKIVTFQMAKIAIIEGSATIVKLCLSFEDFDKKYFKNWWIEIKKYIFAGNLEFLMISRDYFGSPESE